MAIHYQFKYIWMEHEPVSASTAYRYQLAHRQDQLPAFRAFKQKYQVPAC
jgi:hypothetical protein